MFFLPYAAPSTGAFERISPLVAMQVCIALPKGQEAPFGNPVQKRGAQGINGIRVSFLLDTFLWTSKEKYLGCRAETRLQHSRRVSDTKSPSTAGAREI
jgi:hypothetical protein